MPWHKITHKLNLYVWEKTALYYPSALYVQGTMISEVIIHLGSS